MLAGRDGNAVRHRTDLYTGPCTVKSQICLLHFYRTRVALTDIILEVFNFEVEKFHKYFAGTEGVSVHNKAIRSRLKAAHGDEVVFRQSERMSQPRAVQGRLAIVCALGATQTLAWASSTYLPAILAAPIARDLGITRATVFGAFSVSLLVMAACGPLVGRAIDKAGGRNMLIWSNGVLATGLVMLGCAQNVALLFAAWCILGAGMAMGLYDAAFAALVRIYGTDARKPITGITLIAGFASTVGWPLTAYMDAQIGWRGACFVWSALHLLIALPVNWRLIPKVVAGTHAAAAASDTTTAPAYVNSAVSGAAPSATQSSVVPTPRSRGTDMLLLGIYFAATAFVTSAYASHLPGLLASMGAGAAGAVLAAALLGPAQVAARLVEFGVISRYRVHALITARVATALHPLACVVLGMFGGVALVSDSPVAFGVPVLLAALFALLHGAGNGMITIAKGTLPLALFGAAGYGLTQGWLGVGARVMQAGAPYAFGLVLDGMGGHAALVISAVLSLVALGVLFALRPDHSADSY